MRPMLGCAAGAVTPFRSAAQALPCVASASRIAWARRRPHHLSRAMASNTPPVLIYSAEGKSWTEALRAEGLPAKNYPEDFEDPADMARVEFAVCWKPPAGLLTQCTALKGLQSLGAGVDCFMGDGIVPAHVPLARIVDPLMGERMAAWVTWGVINAQRHAEEYLAAQRESRWAPGIEDRRQVDNAKYRVGIMGAGVMGGSTARMLHGMGYDVAAWTRTPLEGAAYGNFVGRDALSPFLARTDVLVCLLPLTQETEGIVDAALLAQLPASSAVINGARGKHVVEADLLAALDSGHIAHAVLDVFDPEPLPEASRLWQHPSVRVFPHVSSKTNIETAVQQIVGNYRRCCDKGEPMQNLVQIGRGY